MPFKSEAQRRKFQQLLKEGKINQKLYDAFENETGDIKLPEKVGAKKEKVVLKSFSELKKLSKKR